MEAVAYFLKEYGIVATPAKISNGHMPEIGRINLAISEMQQFLEALSALENG